MERGVLACYVDRLPACKMQMQNEKRNMLYPGACILVCMCVCVVCVCVFVHCAAQVIEAAGARGTFMEPASPTIDEVRSTAEACVSVRVKPWP